MEIVGILKLKYDTQKVSDKFQKREFVVTTEFDSTYPQHLQMQATQDKCIILDQFNHDDMIKVQINLKGREWNGPQGIKYFNTIEAWKIELVQKTVQAQTPPAPIETSPIEEKSIPNPLIVNNDDLPF